MKRWFVGALVMLLCSQWVMAGTTVERKGTASSKASAKAKAVAKQKAAKTGKKLATNSSRESIAVRVSGLRTEHQLQSEIVAARSVLGVDPRNGDAREIIARVAIVTTDWLLSAEAVGNAAKAERLAMSLKRDFPDAGRRIQTIAQQGDPKAHQALGVLHGRGIVLARDAEKSCKEFQSVASQLAGSAWHWAQCLLEASPAEAWGQMERAALGGHAAAQEWIGRRCLGEFGATGKDFACAREWLSQSASQGRPRAQALYAYLLASGQGGPVDASRAVRLYRLAADQGDADAQNNLGEIHESGRGVEKSPDQALQWYERAAERGLATGQFNAGRMWAIGAAGKSDAVRARAWLAQAEQKGVSQARQVLDWLDQHDEGTPSTSATSSSTPLSNGSQSR